MELADHAAMQSSNIPNTSSPTRLALIKFMNSKGRLKRLRKGEIACAFYTIKQTHSHTHPRREDNLYYVCKYVLIVALLSIISIILLKPYNFPSNPYVGVASCCTNDE